MIHQEPHQHRGVNLRTTFVQRPNQSVGLFSRVDHVRCTKLSLPWSFQLKNATR